ncbi:hypothetical protein AMR76_06565 [Vibrio furnissii]|uniref:Uncharacterized protein n=1 Tax=Vibrio furnissii TaxID=29494 RepID=A0A0Q2Y210_VIBFU|nr:hypothetical protein [Vibrio furnissii]KQH86748.1 hypothetical protein AMR76_06565 [Vibrio furnissii]OQQ02345.1 hypothetical protein BK411_22095 [Vibrio splendidus]
MMKYRECDFNKLSLKKQNRLRKKLIDLGHSMISLDDVSFNRLEHGEITKFGRAKLSFSTLVQDLKKIEKLLCPLTPRIILTISGLKMSHATYNLIEDEFSVVDASYSSHVSMNDEIDVRWVSFEKRNDNDSKR